SPDGHLIALRRLPDDRPLAAGARIAVLNAEGGELRDLTAESDLNVEFFHWMPDGRGLLFTAPWLGEQTVYSVVLENEDARYETLDMRRETRDMRHEIRSQNSLPSPVFPANGRLIAEIDVAPNGNIAFIAGSPGNPCELFVRRPDGSEIQITTINRKLLE